MLVKHILELPGWVSSLVNVSCQQREVELGKSSVRNSSSPCLTCVFHSVSPADWLIDWLIICCLDSAHKTADCLPEWNTHPLTSADLSDTRVKVWQSYRHCLLTFWTIFPNVNGQQSHYRLLSGQLLCHGFGKRGWVREGERGKEREGGRDFCTACPPCYSCASYSMHVSVV